MKYLTCGRLYPLCNPDPSIVYIESSLDFVSLFFPSRFLALSLAPSMWPSQPVLYVCCCCLTVCGRSSDALYLTPPAPIVCETDVLQKAD